MKKICIFLMKVNRWYYLLLGALIGALVFSKVDNVKDMMPNIEPLIYTFIIFGIGFTQTIARHIFYTDEEISAREESGEMDFAKGIEIIEKRLQQFRKAKKGLKST